MENDSNISQINNLTFNNSANIGNGEIRKLDIFILRNNCFDFYSIMINLSNISLNINFPPINPQRFLFLLQLSALTIHSPTSTFQIC